MTAFRHPDFCVQYLGMKLGGQGSRGHSCRDLQSEKTLCCRKVKHNKFGAIRHDLIDKNLDDIIFFLLKQTYLNSFVLLTTGF